MLLIQRYLFRVFAKSHNHNFMSLRDQRSWLVEAIPLPDMEIASPKDGSQ